MKIFDNKYKNIATNLYDILLKIMSRIVYLYYSGCLKDEKLLEIIDDALINLHIDDSSWNKHMYYYQLLDKRK
jgi:hypothetical protein